MLGRLRDIKVRFRLRDQASLAGGVELGHDLFARHVAGGGGRRFRVVDFAGGDFAGVAGTDVFGRDVSARELLGGSGRRGALGESRSGGGDA